MSECVCVCEREREVEVRVKVRVGVKRACKGWEVKGKGSNSDTS